MPEEDEDEEQGEFSERRDATVVPQLNGGQQAEDAADSEKIQ